MDTLVSRNLGLKTQSPKSFGKGRSAAVALYLVPDADPNPNKTAGMAKISPSQAMVLVTLGRELAQLGLEIAEYFGSITL